VCSQLNNWESKKQRSRVVEDLTEFETHFGESLAAQSRHGVDGESSARGNKAGECSHQNE